MEMWSAMKEFREGGRLEGKDQAMLENIKALMRKLNQSEEEAMDTLDIGKGIIRCLMPKDNNMGLL